MFSKIGREPTPEELAEKIGMSLEKVRKVPEDRQGTGLARNADRRRGGFPPRRLDRGWQLSREKSLIAEAGRDY
jgi:hypothetical protein